MITAIHMQWCYIAGKKTGGVAMITAMHMQCVPAMLCLNCHVHLWEVRISEVCHNDMDSPIKWSRLKA